jgi:hypothetical protein
VAVCTAWAAWGVLCSTSQNWQIFMQNFSSIQCYLWDLTLLHAQRSDFEQLSRMYKGLVVRSNS